MPIPEDQLKIAEKGLAVFSDRVPEHVLDKVQIRFRQEGQSFILFEWRPRLLAPEEWHEESVAKFTYVRQRRRWKLFRMDRNLRWRRYEWLPESDKLRVLLKEVENDPYCFFWG